MVTKSQKSSSAVPNLGRHASGCRVCMHPDRQEIENDFVSWKSPAKIATEYNITNRASIYRHARAFNLGLKRARNVHAALERIIEQVDDVQVNAAAVVQAIGMLARMVEQDKVVERNQAVNDLLSQMSDQELDAYAKDGTLPDWSTRTVSATGDHGQGGNEDA
jgi:hypothetical protein